MPRHSPYALVRLNFLSWQIFVRIFAELIERSVLFSSFLLELLEFLENMDIAAKRFSFLLVLLRLADFSAFDKIVTLLIGKT